MERPQSRRVSRQSTRSAQDQNLDEYTRLVRYVSTYREPTEAEKEAEEEGKLVRVWYAPWKKKRVRPKAAAEERAQYPEEWLLTDIKQGLSSEEVQIRRRRSGWNELVSEKANPIAKFLSYFKGPILYGQIPSSFLTGRVAKVSQLWNWLSSFLRVSMIGSILELS